MPMRNAGQASVGEARTGHPDPDGELMALVARGDAGAFETLYHRHASLVHGMALQVLRDRAHAEEVAQEVLVEAWRAAARFDPGRGSARAWLVTMTRLRAIDRVRSVRAAGDRDLRAAAGLGVTVFDEVSEEVETRLEYERVRGCLEGLTTLQRESIDLAFYRGYSYREVSEALATPLGTIKTRLRDSLIRLRDCLGVAA